MNNSKFNKIIRECILTEMGNIDMSSRVDLPNMQGAYVNTATIFRKMSIEMKKRYDEVGKQNKATLTREDYLEMLDEVADMINNNLANITKERVKFTLVIPN